MGSTTADRELLFGEKLVERGLAKPEQVDECLRIQADLRGCGVHPVPRLGELLVYKGYLSPERMQEAVESTPRNPLETAPTWRGPAPNLDRIREGIREHERAPSSSHYELLELLGQGGMGIVYRARDLKLNRIVALKFLHSANPDDGRRFLREGLLAAQLSHPHIVSIHEVGEMEGKPYIAMEYVAGRPLNELRLEPRQAAEVVRDAAEAVHYAHGKGIIHRDLKPANILVSSSTPPRAYVMDFGLAKQAAAGSSLSLSGTVMGTPSYMPPEQALGRVHAVDPRSDVYSLGATLYHALAGKPPFGHESVFETLRQVAHEDATPVRKTRPRVARDLEAIAMKCLEKDPVRRYRSAQDLADDLGRYLAGEAILAHPLTVFYRFRKYAWRRRVAILAGAVTVLAAASLLLYRGLSRGEARGWEREAGEMADQGRFEEAMQLLDRASARIAVDPQLVRRCRERLAAQKELAMAKQLEDEVFGPMWEEIRRLPDGPSGWTRAVALLDQGLARAPDSWRNWYHKAKYHESLFEYEAAQEAYRRAYRINSRLAVAHFARGRILMDYLNRAGEAAAEFEAAGMPELEPLEVLLAQARTAIVRGNFPRALEACEEAKKLGAHRGEPHFLLGCIYGERMQPAFFDPKRAIQEFTSALMHDPGHPTPYLNRGVVHFDQGDFDRALADFIRARDLDPRSSKPQYYAAMAAAGKGDVDSALHSMDHAIRLSPRSPEYFAYRGLLCERKKDWTAAFSDYTQVLSLDPANAAVYNSRGGVRQTLGDFDGAILDYLQAVALHPRHALAYSNLGCARQRRGERLAAADRRKEALDEWQQALNDVNRAIEVDPKLPRAYGVRSAVWVSVAQRSSTPAAQLEWAAQDLEQALAVAPSDWEHRSEVQSDLQRIRDEIRRLRGE